jgi:hypothetical protein
MMTNLEHQFQMKEIQHWMLLYGLGKKNGRVIPYPSAEYVHNNLLSSPDNNPMYSNISHKFERNAALKGDKSWELLAHWYIEGLAVEGYEKNAPNPLEDATVKAKDLKHFVERSDYASPDWLTSALGLANQAISHNSSELQIDSKHLTTREVNSLYRIILGMAIKKYKYDPDLTRNVATGRNAGSISADLEQAGLTVDSETISKHLKAAYLATPPEPKS